MLKLIVNWRREREAVRELSRLSDRELADLGIARADIGIVAGAAVLRKNPSNAALNTVERADTMAPSWGVHNRQTLAA